MRAGEPAGKGGEVRMVASGEDFSRKPSYFGIASSLVGGILVVIQGSVLAALLRGVKDNQGIIYAFSIPFVAYCIGVPLGLLLATIGFLQRNRRRTFPVLGLVLTLTGPLVFVVIIAVQAIFHPW
jgi:CHASE2 domain-containing sensor protein